MPWSDKDEIEYQMWLKQWSRNTGIPYDPNDPYYDYRKVYKKGLFPTFQPEHQQYRWPDIGKSKDYPKGKVNVEDIDRTMNVNEIPEPYYNWMKDEEAQALTVSLKRKAVQGKG